MPFDQHPVLVFGDGFLLLPHVLSLEGYRVYAIPYAFALIGLLAAAALRTDALASLLRKDISAIHRESFRQIRYVMALLFIYSSRPRRRCSARASWSGFFALAYLSCC